MTRKKAHSVCSYLCAACTVALAACTAPPRRPPGLPPSPQSVTMATPGGDAYEPHWAALDRQLAEPWGWRTDKDEQVRFPLPDWENWRRVRIRFIEHLTAFKYGDDRHLLTAAFTIDALGQKQTSASCMELFEEKALDKVRWYNVKYRPVQEHEQRWGREPLVVHASDGELSLFFTRYEFSAAWAAYPAYTDGCLVYAVVVQWDGQPELAQKVRDRWVVEGFSGMQALTEQVPVRRE